MKKIVPFVLVVAGALYSSVAPAQTFAPGENSPLPLTEHNAGLDQRFSQCIQSASCPLQTRLQIVQEENDTMNLHFYKIEQACSSMDFTGCIDPQQGEIDQWHMANGRMQQMMLSIEAQSLAQKETSAGGNEPSSAPDQQGKTPWEKIWGK